MDTKKLVSQVKWKLGFKFDKQLADALNLTRSGLSQKISRGDIPITEIRQLLQRRGIDFSWLDQAEKDMNRDSTNTLNSEKQLLQEKERTITIQQSYIERLEKTIERLEEDKKKWIPTNVPELINQSHNWVNP